MDGVPQEQTTKIFNSRFPWELLLLVVAVLASFAIRLPDRPLHGEETRRGQAAKEIARFPSGRGRLQSRNRELGTISGLNH